LKLPAAPSFGDTVTFFDGVAKCSTKNVTIDRNGNKILGLDENLIIDVDNAWACLHYEDATNGWRIDLGGAVK